MKEITYQIHWLNMTVFGSIDDSIILYDILFRDTFGDLQSLGHGGRSFKEIQRGLAEFKLYTKPAKNNKEFFHIEIPGSACDALNWEGFQAIYEYLNGNFPDNFKFTRIDFAFDHLNFSPEQALDVFKNDQVRSLAKRDSLEVIQSPFALRDNLEIGTSTINFGSRTSERFLRIYNKRGFTRLEFELKGERANIFATDLLKEQNESRWFKIAIGHLRDYIDFDAEWWTEFISGNARAYRTLSKPSEVSLQKITHWIEKQVAPALSVLDDTLPYGDLKHIIAKGRIRRKDKYNLLIENAGGNPGKVPAPRKGTQGGISVSSGSKYEQ